MATTEVQPCESCDGKVADDDDLYQRARPGSKALAGGWRFERLCTDCRQDVTSTGGGDWATPPPARPPSKRGFGRR